MCGIVGMGSLSGLTEWTSKEKWFTKALYVDTLRGFHSTGIFYVPYENMNEPPEVYKKALPGYDFLDLTRPRSIIKHIDKYAFIVGHNRHATTGTINTENAHPFQKGHITLVHNGTLTSRHGVPSVTEVEVDSEAICHAFATKGASETLPKLNGAYALVWYDSEKGTLNLARNKERPLFFAFSKNGDNILFASESWMVKELAGSAFGIETIFSLKPGIHVELDGLSTDLRNYTTHEFDVYENKWWEKSYYGGGSVDCSSVTNINKSNRKKAQKARLENLGYAYGEQIYFRYKMFNHYRSNASRGNMFGDVDMGVNHPTDSVVAYNVDSKLILGNINSNKLFVGTAVDCFFKNDRVEVILDNITEVVSLPHLNNEEEEGLVLGPDNVGITIDVFNELVKHGCGQCSTDISPEDAEDIDWINNSPICSDCLESLTQG